MNQKYVTLFMSGLLVLSLTSALNAQTQKTKTITIVNGDTTISEINLDEKELKDLDKQIQVTMSGGNSSEKKVIKKIIINDDKKEDNMVAYAYSTGDADIDDVQITTDESGTETKIIIKKGGDKDAGEKTTVVKKGAKLDDSSAEKNTMNINIRVKDTNAKVEIESSSKEPMNVSILDENGKQVFYDSQKTGGTYSKDIPLGKKGTYFLNFIQNKTSKTEKIIVK